MAFRDLIFRNFRRKVFSLLLAILVWMTIHLSERHRTQTQQPALPTNSAVIYP